MSSEESAHNRRSKATSKHEEELEELLVHYIDRLTSGDMLDKLQIAQDHPDLAPELVRRLEAFEVIGSGSLPDIPLGTLGDYTLRREIGRGGMGVVYDAWQNSMDRRVALKVLPPGMAADNRAFHRFMREAKTAGQLSHQNVVAVYSTGVEEGTPWYSMEFVEGETLAHVLARLKKAEEDETPFGKRSEQQYYLNMAKAFADVADGLQHAHSKGVIHRDIKPSNLILDEEGRLRILDFGLARLEGQESLTVSGDFVGTPLYVSPEQARQRKSEVDHRTDVYSLGATLYEVIAGRPPFKGRDHQDTLSQIIDRDPVEPRKLNQRVPRDLETIVLKCLQKDPGDRYGTAEALGQDLRRCVRGDAIEARPLSGWERLVRKISRNRHKLRRQVTVLLLLSCLGVLGYMLVRAEWEADHLRKELAGPDPVAVLGGSFEQNPEVIYEIEEDPDGIHDSKEPHVFGPAISADELTIYFTYWKGSPRNDPNIYFMTRKWTGEPFERPARSVDGLNTAYEDWVYGNCLSSDGQEMYFSSNRGGRGNDLYVARFEVPGNPEAGFRDIENLGPGVNGPGEEYSPNISQDGLRLYYNVGEELYVATRKEKEGLFANAVRLSTGLDGGWVPAISPDELTLFWVANLPPPHGCGGNDIWIATRESIVGASGLPVRFRNMVNLGPPFNTDVGEAAPCLTANWPGPGSGLYFCRNATTILRAAWHPRGEAPSQRAAEAGAPMERRQ